MPLISEADLRLLAEAQTFHDALNTHSGNALRARHHMLAAEDALRCCAETRALPDEVHAALDTALRQIAHAQSALVGGATLRVISKE